MLRNSRNIRKYYFISAIIILILIITMPHMIEAWNKNYPYRRFKKLSVFEIPNNVISTEVLSSEGGFESWELLGFEGNDKIIRKWIRNTEKTHSVNWLKGPVTINNSNFQVPSFPNNIELNLYSDQLEYCFVYLTPEETRNTNCVLVLVEPNHKKIWMYSACD